MFTILLTLLSTSAQSQRIEPIAYGDMAKWQTRTIKESRIIGGATKTIYDITDTKTTQGNVPFVNTTSNWANSSAYAKVSGVSKGSITVFPEDRGNGDLAVRLETKLEEIKVLGIINITALATGSIFLGHLEEPITDTKNPLAKLMQGIPFTDRPSFLQFDYKFKNENGGKRIMDSGFSSSELPGVNAGEACVLLQRRWEDAEGNIFAERVGTGWRRYSENVYQWIDNERVKIMYGDITKDSNFESYMNLIVNDPLYTKNSKGKAVPIQEVGWAAEGATPTHIVLRISSGYGGAFVGSPGATMWVDNIALGYND
ncbi:MAG: PCMD domain-containing protein [Rikenellaceae bacterium]